MKRIVSLLFAAALLATACNKESRLPEVGFAETFYSIYAGGTVDVTVKLSSPAGTALSVPVLVTGEAAIDKDFSLSSHYAEFAPGERSTVITVTDLHLTAEKSITLTIQAGDAYRTGAKNVTIISLDEGETLVYNFSSTSAVLYEKVQVTLTVEGIETRKNYRAPRDLVIPLSIKGNEKGYVIPPEGEVVIREGTASAILEFTPADNIPEDMPEDVTVLVSVDGDRFIPGDNGALSIKVESGIQVPSRLLGKWVFDHIYDLEELEMWFEEGEEDLSLFPFNNTDFTLEFTEEGNGIILLTPGKTGDFAAYFTETTPVILTTPKNYSAEGTVLGKYTVSEINMFEAEETGATDPQIWTYYLIDANRAFSKSTKSVGNSVIAFRLTEDGDLDMQFRDYDTPPFGTVYWWSDTHFDADMFSFASLFKKVTE